jgi:hypothetical protein
VIGGISSADVQWNDVLANVTRIRVQSYFRGTIAVALSRSNLTAEVDTLSVAVNSNVSVFFALNHPPTDVVTLSVKLPSGLSVADQTGTVSVNIPKLQAVYELAIKADDSSRSYSNIEISSATSADYTFDRAIPSVQVIPIYVAVPGKAVIRVSDQSQPVTSLRLQMNATASMELLITPDRSSKVTLSGGYVPVSLPLGYSLLDVNGTDISVLRFGTVSLNDTVVVKFQVKSSSAPGVYAVTFGSIVSTDLQWSAVTPSPATVSCITLGSGVYHIFYYL